MTRWLYSIPVAGGTAEFDMESTPRTRVEEVTAIVAQAYGLNVDQISVRKADA